MSIIIKKNTQNKFLGKSIPMGSVLSGNYIETHENAIKIRYYRYLQKNLNLQKYRKLVH